MLKCPLHSKDVHFLAVGPRCSTTTGWTKTEPKGSDCPNRRPKSVEECLRGFIGCNLPCYVSIAVPRDPPPPLGKREPSASITKQHRNAAIRCLLFHYWIKLMNKRWWRGKHRKIHKGMQRIHTFRDRFTLSLSYGVDGKLQIDDAAHACYFFKKPL